jgi:hypothetical protein
MQQIGKARHDHRVEHVHLKEDLITNVVPKERDSLDQRDMANIDCLAIVGIPTICSGQGMVDGGAERLDIGGDCSKSVTSLLIHTSSSPVSLSRLPAYSIYRYGSAP